MSGRKDVEAMRFLSGLDLNAEEQAALERDAKLFAAFRFVSGAPDYTPDKAREVFYRLLNLEQRTGDEPV